MMRKIRQEYGEGRFWEFGVLEPPEQDEHFYLLIGFSDDKPPIRILFEAQDIWSIRLFLEKATWEVVNPWLKIKKELEGI